MTVVSGHQPAYLPWLGLLHKASLCDVFVFMDDVQFLDRDFIHRNRVMTPDGKVLWLTVPVARKESASPRIKDIRIAGGDGRPDWRKAHWLTLQTCYGKAPFFREYAPFFQWLYLENRWERLADLNRAIFDQALEWFGLSPRVVTGSEQNFQGRKSDLVLEHGLRFGADTVVTGAMGRDYIRCEDFEAQGIRVVFQDYVHPVYDQGREPFTPRLSFVDLLFRRGPESAAVCLSGNLSRSAL